MNEFPHYFRPLPPGCTHIDVYRVLQLFEVGDPALQHAVKKLLCAGARGTKDQAQDVSEAVAALQRWQQMREEEQPPTDLRDAVAEIREIFENDAASPEDAERAAYFEQFVTSEPQPVDFGPFPEHPHPDHVAEGFRRKSEREALAIKPYDYLRSEMRPESQARASALADELRREINRADTPHNMSQWLLSMESGLQNPGFDEWHAAYLERWKNAPCEATHLSEDSDGSADWWLGQPVLPSGACDGVWIGMQSAKWLCSASTSILGSVRCEPRPTLEGGQGAGP